MNMAKALLLGCFFCGPTFAGNAGYTAVAWKFDLPVQISPAAFTVCSQHGCATRVGVSLNIEQWRQIEDLFDPIADSAAAERRQIAAAVGRMEQLVGGLASTHHDKGGNFSGFTQPGSQLDCEDESANTTTYLTLFEQEGLLRWHRVMPRASRGFLFFGGWPHFTATVETTQAVRERWAVDSWFQDNGVQAEVVPVSVWKEGWAPPDFSR